MIYVSDEYDKADESVKWITSFWLKCFVTNIQRHTYVLHTHMQICTPTLTYGHKHTHPQL